MTRPAGLRRRRSIRRSTYQYLAFSASRRPLRCAPGGITAEVTPARSVQVAGSRNRCSRSISADSAPPIGHWEADLIVVPHHRSAIGTLVERRTCYVKLLHLPRLDSITTYAALVRVFRELPPGLRWTLTWDQRTEMAKHLDVTADTGICVDFCDAASPWQRGTNENTNGLLRQYFPKSADLSVHTPKDLTRVERELNERPRIVLGDRSPHELFSALLPSQNHPSLQ